MPYPRVRSTRGDQRYVPFPNIPPGGWVPCPPGSANDPTDPGCWRHPRFHDFVDAFYTANGWAEPIYRHQAHHICPRGWRNCGNSPDNGVLLSVPDHSPFNRFWQDFRPRYFW